MRNNLIFILVVIVVILFSLFCWFGGIYLYNKIFVLYDSDKMSKTITKTVEISDVIYNKDTNELVMTYYANNNGGALSGYVLYVNPTDRMWEAIRTKHYRVECTFKYDSLTMAVEITHYKLLRTIFARMSPPVTEVKEKKGVII